MINIRKARLILLICLSVWAVYASGQSVSNKDSLRKDFQLLITNLHQYYPSLYRYTSKPQMTALLDSCYNSIQDTTSNVAFFRMLKFLVSQIRDGHIGCSPSPELRQYLAEQQAYFPFRVRFINNKAYIFSAPQNSLPPGMEILAINDQPLTEIQKRLYQFIVSDGFIETKKNSILANYFYIYYYLAIGPRSSFAVTYKTANGSIHTQQVQAVLEKNLPPIEEDSQENPLLNLTVTPDHIAILTIRSFDKDMLDEAKLDFEEFLRTTFTSLRKQQIKRLVIDLRGNGGGRDLYGSLLYSYLSKEKFHYYKSLTAATDKLPFDQFKRGSTSFNDLNPALLSKTAAGYQLQPGAHNNLQELSPAANNYTHAVWFLADGRSYSVTAEFCAIAHSYKRGKFIGEETGGGYEGNTSAARMDILLPASHTTVSFGTIQYDMAVRKENPAGRGTMPDYPVLPAIQDLLNKRDIQLERTLELVRSGK